MIDSWFSMTHLHLYKLYGVRWGDNCEW